MKRILLIEDDAQLRECMVEIVRQEGYDTLCASSVEDGLMIARAAAPDLMFLDMQLAEGDGYSLLELIRQDDKIAHVPVVVMTGRNDAEILRRGKELGVADYLFKPFTLSSLVTMIQQRFGMAAVH
jgi:CheY-like chemotaxis protein